MTARRTRHGTSRAVLALRGTLALVVLTAGTIFAVGGTSVLTRTPLVSGFVPSEAGPVRPDSSVEYRGVVVGKLADVQPARSGARLTMAVDAAKIQRVPAAARLRVLPKTLFGDQIVELAVPRGAVPTAARLSPGAVLMADTGPQTVQLYNVYTRLYDLVDRLRPAELQVALSTVAEAVHGRGADLGHTIDAADSLSRKITPGQTGQALTDLADISRRLARSTPDVMAALDDAVSLSRTVTREHRSIERLLSSGTQLAAQSQDLVAENGKRAVQVVHLLDPATQALAANPDAPRSSLDNLTTLFTEGSKTFQGGRFQIRAPLTFENPYPYGPQDCPRYPGLNGPNCGAAKGAADPPGADPAGAAPGPAGGTTGPVGSPQEKAALREMLPQLPAPPGAPVPGLSVPASSGPAELLAGPIVRGTRVVVR